MRLSHFIRQNLCGVTDEWTAFAKDVAPTPLTDLKLRDHIHEILFFIADDIESAQSAQQQLDKSHGKNLPLPGSAGCTHGDCRYEDGFNVVQLVMEYRALRASIMRLWMKSRPVLTGVDMGDILRFHESIDQLQAESVAFFTKRQSSRREVA